MNFQNGKKTILHCWFLHTVHKHIGYEIIPKPHFSSREGINSRCRRFDLLFSPFWFNLSPLWSRLSPLMLSLAIDRPWPALPLVHSTDTCARLGLRDSFWVFFTYIKKLLGRTETRTRDRMDCQSIRIVWDISRVDRKFQTELTWYPLFEQDCSVIGLNCGHQICTSKIPQIL